MISLANFLAYLFIGECPWSNLVRSDDDKFSQVREIKLKQTPETICEGFAKPLLPFVREVYAYAFEEEPHYKKLK